MPPRDAFEGNSRPSRNYYDRLPANAVIKISPAKNGDAFRESSDRYLNNMTNTAVKAPLPEAITIGLANTVGQTWDFWKVVKGGAVTAATFGVSANKGVAERQFWQEIEPKDVTVELMFNAHSDAKQDVYHPCNMLLKYAAASDSDQSIADFSWRRPAYIDVRIGRIATYYSCIIRSVDIVYSNKVDPEGFPISATASLTFVTRDPIGWRHVESWVVDGDMPLSSLEVATGAAIDQAGDLLNSIGNGWKLIGGALVNTNPANTGSSVNVDQINRKTGAKMG